MKKTLLLLVAALFVTVSMSAQKVWNFSDFEPSTGIGAGPGLSVFIQDLGIHTGTQTGTNMGAVNSNSKTFGSYSFTQRFQFGGGGYPGANAADEVPTVNMPTQRFVTVKVTGPGTIIVHGLTASSSSDRRLFVTDGVNLLGNLPFPASTDVSEQTLQYTGGPTVLYFFCNNGINLYRLEVTSATTHSIADFTNNVEQVLVDKGVFFNGSEVVNPNAVRLEVFNVVGKRVATSNTTINMSSFEKGIYFVRSADVKGVIKFSK